MKVKVVVYLPTYLCQAVSVGCGGGGHVQYHGECGADPDSFLIKFCYCLSDRCNVHTTLVIVYVKVTPMGHVVWQKGCVCVPLPGVG